MPYVGCSMPNCYILKQKSDPCCLRLLKECDHSKKKHVYDYQWENKSIILAAKYATYAIHNFIVQLRSISINENSINPIILLIENE